MQADPVPRNGDRRRRPTPGGVLVAVLGTALFVYAIRHAGVGAVADGVARLGWAFAAVVALGGLRFALRAAAWLRCLESGHRLGLRHLFLAVVAGDALGNLTPLGIVVSEPTKALLLRRREPLGRTLPALAVENLFYTLSAVLVVAAGLAVLPFVLQAPGRLWLAASVVFLTLAALLVGAHWAIRNRIPVGSALLVWLQGRGVAPRLAARGAERARAIEDRMHALYPRRWSSLLPVALLEIAFHACAVVEVFLVLTLIGPRPPTLLDAFVLESTNRLIAVAFRFVPLRIGVDEAGTGFVADLLAFGTAAGVTLAVVRKGRMLVWTALGLAALVGRGVSLSPGPVRRAAAGGVAVAIMARSPAAGDAPKTRLADAVPREADRRRLYAAFLTDTIAACRTVAGAALRVAYTPDGGSAGLREVGARDGELLPQRGADLGARERGVFDDLFAAGFDAVVLIGSDLPTLPPDNVRHAISAVSPNAVVLGPSDDGGYYLIALAAPPAGMPIPDLFSGIRWSTPSALDDTRAAAARAGLDVVLVPGWHDVDDAAGLARLRTELRQAAIRARAPATARVLDDLLGLADGSA